MIYCFLFSIIVLKECLREVEELKLCKSCFFLSNTKPMKDWFCQPCVSSNVFSFQ